VDQPSHENWYHTNKSDFTVCICYRGLKPLLTKWEGAGFSRDLKELHLLLQAGNAQKAENEVKLSN
jgi:hypothetical protein